MFEKLVKSITSLFGIDSNNKSKTYTFETLYSLPEEEYELQNFIKTNDIDTTFCHTDDDTRIKRCIMTVITTKQKMDIIEQMDCFMGYYENGRFEY